MIGDCEAPETCSNGQADICVCEVVAVGGVVVGGGGGPLNIAVARQWVRALLPLSPLYFFPGLTVGQGKGQRGGFG